MNKFLALISVIMFAGMLNGCAWKAGVDDDMANAAAEKNKPVAKAEAKADVKPAAEASQEKTAEVAADKTTDTEKAADNAPDMTNN